MHIVLVDDSISFDGDSPSTQPLGGAEKAFASLPGALARRGHRVQVFNRIPHPKIIDRAHWESWSGIRPVACDALIAFRKPELLNFIATAAHRILWLAAPAGYLREESHQGLFYAHRPTLVFLGESHRAGYGYIEEPPRTEVIAPGIRADYLDGKKGIPLQPPYAVATSHPQLGLEWLARLWADRVYPSCPHAELRIYSAILHRAALGEFVPALFKAVADAVLIRRDRGISVHPPAADPAMAEAYRGARAHLYPGDQREVYCHTLAESQACGVPTIARPFPAVAEQVEDQVSGKLLAEDDAFAGAVLNLLEDDESQARLGDGAWQRGRGRSWDTAAAAFEAIWS